MWPPVFENGMTLLDESVSSFMNRIASPGLLGILILIFGGLSVYFTLNPSFVWWGLSNGADLEAAARVVWFTLGGTLLLSVAALRGTAGGRYMARIWPRPRGRGAWFSTIGLAALFAGLALFWRSRNHFLGDGWLLITLLENDGDPIPTRPGMGTLLFYRLFLRTFRGYFPALDEEWTFAILAAVAGFFAFLWAVRGARALASLGRDQDRHYSIVLAVGLLLTTGVTQLYFGYVENYAWLTLFVLGFLVEGTVALLKGRSFAPTALCLIAAISAHWLGMILLPPFLYLLMERKGWRLPGVLKYWPEAAPIIFILVMPTTGQLRIKGFFLPWIAKAGDTHLGIFSLAHLLDLLNLSVVLLPVPILIGVLFLWHRNASEAQSAEGEMSDTDSRAVLFRFLRSVAILTVAYGMTIRPWLGPRDWDLISLPVTPVAFWAAARVIRSAPSRDLPRYALLAVLGGSFLLYPWILGNHSLERGGDRTARMVLNDPNHVRGKNAWITGLAWMMMERGADRSARFLIQEGTRLAPHSAVANANRGILLWLEGNYKEALPHLQKAAELNPEALPIRYYLGACEFQLKRGDLGEEHFVRFLDHYPNNSSAASYLGRIYLVRGDWRRAIETLGITYRQLPDNAYVNLWLGHAHFNLGEDDVAGQFLKRAIELKPNIESAGRMLEQIAARR